MSEIAYVSEEALRLAEEWERRFSTLPADAGILFVSIKPRSARRGLVHVFDVFFGFTKTFNEELAGPLGRSMLADQLPLYEFNFQGFRGITGAACDAAARKTANG